MGSRVGSSSMVGTHVEQPAAGGECCLKPSPANAPDMQHTACGQQPAIPPVDVQTSLTLHCMQPELPELSPEVSLPSLGVGRPGGHADSAGQFTDALAAYGKQQKSCIGLSTSQLQPILALFNAAQQAKRGLLIRAASCELPEGSGRKLPHKRTPNVLYKTELCRTWSATGQCRYGGKCQFAHGFHELRPVQRHPKYRTEVCRTFAATGSCPYRARCKFIHSRRSSSDSYRSDEEEHIAPVKAHSLPPNFGSPAAPTHGAVLTALCSLLAKPQGSSLAYHPASASARSPAMRSNGVLAPASDPGSFPGGMVSCGGYQYDGGQASSNHPLNMQCEGSPFARDICSAFLPIDPWAAQGPQGSVRAVAAQLPTVPPHAQWPSTACSNGFGAAGGLEACCNEMQGLWNWEDNTSTAATSSDPKTDSAPKTEAYPAPFYPAVSRRAIVPV